MGQEADRPWLARPVVVEHPKPPLFLFIDGEMVVCSSLEEISFAPEPWDAEQSYTYAFDRNGWEILVEGVGVSRTRISVWGGQTSVTPTSPPILSPSRLAEELRRQLGALSGSAAEWQQASLDDLIEAAVRLSASE